MAEVDTEPRTTLSEVMNSTTGPVRFLPSMMTILGHFTSLSRSFSSYETSHSVGGAKMENPETGTLSSRTWLAGSSPQQT